MATTIVKVVPTCFICVVCKENTANSDPEGSRILPCLHHICSEDCLSRSLTVNGSSIITCSECLTTFDKSQLGRNNYSKDYPAFGNGVSTNTSKKEVQCTFCSRGDAASSYCTECKDFLCNQCVEHHKYMKLTKAHALQTVEDGLLARENELPVASGANDEAKCSIHDKVLSLYCVECDEEVCTKCSKANHHTNHDIRDLSDCAKEFREMLGNAIPELIRYREKTTEAIVDLAAKVESLLGTERMKLLETARTHVRKIQALLLEKELEIRTEIVKKTVYKAKEVNVKRVLVESMGKQTFQYLQLIPKLLEYKDHQLFSKRQWLTKQYFRLRESVGVLLDEKRYKNYVESDWFFHMGDGVLLDTIVALKSLGGIVYTDGDDIQDQLKPLFPTTSLSSIPGSLESILERKYRDKHPKELTDHLSISRKAMANGTSDSIEKKCDIELESIETSIENEYIGFDIIKSNIGKVDVKETVRFLPGTTLASLLDEKVTTHHPGESDLLSKYIADKTNIEDGGHDSNSEYDPVVQTAKGVEKRRNTHSESEDDRDLVVQEIKKRFQKKGRPIGTNKSQASLEAKLKASIQVKQPSLTPSPPAPAPVRKSSRFEVSPRPGLALASGKTRRVIASRDDAPGPSLKIDSSKPITSKGNRGVGKVEMIPGSQTVKSPVPVPVSVPITPIGRKNSSSRRVKHDDPPRLTREVYLDAQQVEELLATPNESEESHEEGEEGEKEKEKKVTKKRKHVSSDEDFDISGSEHEERRKNKGSLTNRKKKDPFTKPQRRRKSKKKESDALSPSQMPNLAMDIFIQNEKMKISNDDANEDYCTVCLDGGDDLICCDKCPKVFHIKCHLPALNIVPPDAWQCLFCTDKEALDKYTLDMDSTAVQSILFPPTDELKKTDFVYACKFITEIYGLKSSLLVRGYFEKMYQLNHGETPIHLNLIRRRLTLMENDQFKTLSEVYDAVMEMKRQAELLYPETSEYGECYREFVGNFEKVILKYFPGENEEPNINTNTNTNKTELNIN